MIVDAEALVLAWLRSQFPGARVVSELPADLVGNLPALQVARVGGADSQFLDHPMVDVDIYGVDRETARALAYQVWDNLRYTLPGNPAATHWVSRVTTIAGPNADPYPNPDVRRFSLTVQLIVRRG